MSGLKLRIVGILHKRLIKINPIINIIKFYGVYIGINLRGQTLKVFIVWLLLRWRLNVTCILTIGLSQLRWTNYSLRGTRVMMLNYILHIMIHILKLLWFKFVIWLYCRLKWRLNGTWFLLWPFLGWLEDLEMVMKAEEYDVAWV